MKHAALLCMLLLLVSVPVQSRTPGAPAKARQSRAVPMLVSTDWLHEHLNDPGLLVLHVASSNREYKKRHIPGALFLWNQALAQSNEELSLEMPTRAAADSMMKRLGVTDRGPIVIVFEGSSISPATRVLLALEYLGLGDRLSFLDGGLDAWKSAGYPVTNVLPAPAPGTYVPRLHPELVVNADWLAKNLNSPNVAVVDARDARFYEGRAGGMPRQGHIPGAVNIPFSSLADSTNRIKNQDSLRAIFRAAGVTPGKTVVSYCHIGQQATLVYFAARYLGYEARLYDGSFEDWSSRDELPVENPAPNEVKTP